MAQLNISDSLYQQLHEQARESGQSLEAVLTLVTASQHLASPAFMSSVTHDMRTPLAAIMTSADILKHYFDRLSEAHRLDHLAVIQIQVKMLNDMLDNVMIIQQQATDDLQVEVVPEDLAALCQQIIAEIAVMTHTTHPIDLTTTGEMFEATVDRNLMRLALVNVLLNATRFSDEGSAIQVRLNAAHNSLTIAITDSGIGIPTDEQALVFDAFRRASNASHIPGNGLGLTVTRHILALHNGDIRLESTPDAGTTVTLQVPITP